MLDATRIKKTTTTSGSNFFFTLSATLYFYNFLLVGVIVVISHINFITWCSGVVRKEYIDEFEDRGACISVNKYYTYSFHKINKYISLLIL